MKVLFIILLTVLSFKALAQDNIIQTNGTEIKAKVLTLDTDTIKYKRFDNLEGPTYSILKSQVFMIQYENGTRDILNQSSSAPINTPINTPISTPINDSLLAIKDSLSGIIRSHLFLGIGMRAGMIHSKRNNNNINNQTVPPYSSIGFVMGFDTEIGSVHYFAPKKMPKNFGVGLSMTWVNFGALIGDGTVPLAPFTTSVGPQISYKPAKETIVDFFVKPGLSLVYTYAFRPLFLMDVGINIRYKYLVIGISGCIMPTIVDSADYSYSIGYNYYRSTTPIPYDYSFIRLRIGAHFDKR